MSISFTMTNKIINNYFQINYILKCLRLQYTLQISNYLDHSVLPIMSWRNVDIYFTRRILLVKRTKCAKKYAKGKWCTSRFQTVKFYDWWTIAIRKKLKTHDRALQTISFSQHVILYDVGLKFKNYHRCN